MKLNFFILPIILFSSVLVSYAAESPVLLFSDMESGPNVGWSSAEPNRGAAITIWGRDLGDGRGDNYVSVNGVDLESNSDYATWGEYWPTPFYQRITFWLNSNMTDGLGEITVTVNGKKSNSLPFTIRDGNIYFVSADNSGGDGSLENPLHQPSFISYGNIIFNPIKPGDIFYFRDGVPYTTGGLGNNAILRINDSGNVSHPLSFISYPGEKALFYLANYNVNLMMGVNSAGDYQVFSGFQFDIAYMGIYSGSNGGRIIGNDFNGMKVKANGGTGTVTTTESDIHVLGNNIYGGRSKWRLDHAIYLGGCSPNKGVKVGWNYIHDNDFGRGPEIAVNHQEDRCSPGTEIMDAHFIFNNIVDCLPQRANIINVYDLSYDTGEPEPEPTYVYNNIFMNCGTLDKQNTDNIGWSPAIIASTGRGASRFYNNTIYNTNYVGYQAYDSALGSYFRNNIVVMNSSDILEGDSHHYLDNRNSLGNNIITNNLFYDIGDFSVDTTGVDLSTNLLDLDPLFVDPVNLNFDFLKGSPAIDAGANDLLFEVSPPSYAPISKDIFGRDRVGNYDLGAVEFSSPKPEPGYTNKSFWTIMLPAIRKKHQ